MLPPSAASLRYRFHYGVDNGLDSITAPGATTGAARRLRVARTAAAIDSLTDADGGVVRLAALSGAPGRYHSRTDRRGTRTVFTREVSSNTLAQAELELGPSAAITHVWQTAHAMSAAPLAPPTPLDSVRTTHDGPRSDVGDVTTYWLSRLGAPDSIENALGQRTRITRGDVRFPGLVTRVVAPNGLVTTAGYTARGNLDTTAVVAPYGAGSPTAVTRYTWDTTFDRPTSITPPSGPATTMTYDATTGEMTSARTGSDPARTVHFRHYASGPGAGQLRAVQQGAAVDSLTYDALGNVQGTRTPLGILTTRLGDALGRDTLTLSPVDSAQTLFRRDLTRYDLMGRVVETISRGPAITGVPSGVGSLPPPVDSLTAHVLMEYDAEGNQTRVERRSTPATLGGLISATLAWTYDGAGRVVARTEVDTHATDSTGYDPAGNVVRTVSRRGHVLTTTYDALGRPVRRVAPAVSYARECVAEYLDPCRFPAPLHPNSGQSLVIPADTAELTYDVAGNLVRAVNRDGEIGRGYYPNGLLRTDTLRVRTPGTLPFENTVSWSTTVLGYAYDAAGRLTSLTGPDGEVTGYGYDAESGQLGTVTSPTGVVFGRSYDTSDRLRLSTVTPAGGGGAITIRDSLTYDADGRLTRRVERSVAFTSPLHEETLRYDARGKVRHVQAWALDGNRHETHELFYDGLGAVVASRMTPGSGTGEWLEEFRNDAFGNIVWERSEGGVAESAGEKPGMERPARVRVYSEDGRLESVSATAPGPYATSATWPDDRSYGYDASGNLVWEGSAQHVYRSGDLGDPYDSPVTGRTDVRYYYGSDQRLRAVQRFVTRYDIAPSNPESPGSGGHVSTVQSRWGTFEEYRYDPLGRRIVVRARRDSLCTVPGCYDSTDRFVWAGDQLYQETRSGGPHAGTIRYVHGAGAGAGIDSPLMVGGIVPHANWRGQYDSGTLPSGGASDCSLGGGAGCLQVDWPARYLKTYLLTQPDRVPRWYGSLIQDQRDGSGLMYRRNRYYDPVTGRFTQEDPIGLAGGLNLYGFAAGDPVNYTDPFGLCPECRMGWGSPTAENAAQEARYYENLTNQDRAGMAVIGGAAVAGGVGIMAASSGATAAAGVATFYRGVSASEAAQIGADKVLKAIGGIEGAKYLTNTAKAAGEWGRRMHGEGARVVEVTVSRASAARFEYLKRIDGIGEAWVAKIEDLKNAAVRILPP